MSTVTETHSSSAQESFPSQLYRLSVEQYETLVASGAFGRNDRLHLIDGLLVAKMTQNNPHCTADDLCGEALVRVLPSGWYVRASKPIRLPDQMSKPEPDRCVVQGAIRDYRERSPGAADVAMVVDVADSSLADDRGMARLYGASGIPIYWIINLVDRQIEVYTTPDSNGYHSRQDFVPGQLVPVVVDQVEVGRIAVEDMLP